MDILAIGKLLAEVVNEQTGLSTYIANPNAARPDGSVCSVKFFTSEQIGLPAIQYENDDSDPDYDLLATYTGLRELTYTLNFQRDDSLQNSINFKGSLYKDSVISKFIQNDIAFVSATSPVNGVEPVGDSFEERSSMDVVLRTVQTIEDVVKSIDTLNITLTTDNFSQDYTTIIEVSNDE